MGYIWPIFSCTARPPGPRLNFHSDFDDEPRTAIDSVPFRWLQFQVTTMQVHSLFLKCTIPNIRNMNYLFIVGESIFYVNQISLRCSRHVDRKSKAGSTVALQKMISSADLCISEFSVFELGRAQIYEAACNEIHVLFCFVECVQKLQQLSELH